MPRATMRPSHRPRRLIHQAERLEETLDIELWEEQKKVAMQRSS